MNYKTLGFWTSHNLSNHTLAQKLIIRKIQHLKISFTPSIQHQFNIIVSAQVKQDTSGESNTTVVFPIFLFITETKLKNMDNIQ